MAKMPVALTIAGSDSGGGAGIQADLKTFAVMGVHGTSAITSITAQNTKEVRAIFDLPPEMVVSQVEAIADDLGVDAAKTGMLSNSRIIEAVSDVVDKYGFPLVVDPVMIAKSGARLLREDAVDALKRLLIPKATVVTPNTPEAEVLSGIKIVDRESQEEAARIIVEELGAEAAVVKGGHMNGDYSIDILYHKGRIVELKSERLAKNTTHGTGCAFSAAIAAGLAKGRTIEDAVSVAKQFITTAIDYGLELGRGVGPVNPVAWQAISAERWAVIETLKRAALILKENEANIVKVIPEVQMNIGMSIPYPYARTPLDVAAFPGRIGTSMNRLVFKAEPEFGASRHIARLILTAMKYNPNIRSAANIRYSKEIITVAKELGFTIAKIDRREEPPEIKSREGATLPWIISEVVKKTGMLPDIIYDEGDHGKEAMTRVLGENAMIVAEKIAKIASNLSSP